ncbi:unnamed protein product [Adineta ricciae]|uniref:Metalloprotease TIKI homolog n=1 Tax=Adineta ricciae TaxID=249248 RepID=A0A816FC18_ADIRI|nr:unnamed protein product [Adineta ricciae]
MLNLVLGFVLLVDCSICSATLLWRIETSPPAYILGTIHIPYNLVSSHVSNEIRKAFQSSTHFYAEIDAKNDAYWDEFHQCLLNRSLRARRSNEPMAEGDLFDIHLAEEARRLNKTVGSLEPAEYHCENEGWRYNISTWQLILNVVRKEMKSRPSNIINAQDYLQESINKKYICDEIDRNYIETLIKSPEERKSLEQRDAQMSKHIHRLLHRSNKNRYFFAIGAGN